MKTALQTYQLIPKLIPVGLLLLGLMLGFAWAYKFGPNVYLNAEPVNLSQDWQQEYVKQVAWQFAATNDSANATRQLSALGDAKEVVALMLANPTLAGDASLGPKLLAIQPFASDDPQQLGKISQSFPFRLDLTPLLCVIGLALLVGVPVIVNAIVPFSTLVTLVIPNRKADSETVVTGLDAQRRQAIAAAQAAQQSAPVVAPQVAGIQGDPVARFISTYLLNDDAYDDSFSVETPDGQFLGEMGGGISKVLGTDKPKKVTAIEVWVFDTMSTRTMTKVLASDNAYNDPATRGELAAKGEVILAKPGTVLMLEADGLIVQARVIDVSYGTGNTPPNSFFDRITFELSAWGKAAGSRPSAPSSGPGTYTPPYTPPPAAPTSPTYAAPAAPSAAPTFAPPPSSAGNPTFAPPPSSSGNPLFAPPPASSGSPTFAPPPASGTTFAPPPPATSADNPFPPPPPPSINSGFPPPSSSDPFGSDTTRITRQ